MAVCPGEYEGNINNIKSSEQNYLTKTLQWQKRNFLLQKRNSLPPKMHPVKRWFMFSSVMNKDISFPPSSNLKYAKVEVEHCQMSFWDSQKLPIQDDDSGLPNEQISITPATQAAVPSDWNCSVTSRAPSPMCSVVPILNANIFQTSWQ